MHAPVGGLLHPFHPPMSEVAELVSGNATWRVSERCVRAWGVTSVLFRGWSFLRDFL
jgi:hypothetical protein